MVVLSATQLKQILYVLWTLFNRLSSSGYQLAIRQSLGGTGSGSSVFKELRHTFLVVKGRDDCNVEEDYVVDLQFRSQFAVSQCTPAYESLLQTVPYVFVGPITRLIQSVQVLL
jgi:uncharacterized protein (TIGR01615 family)